MPNELTGLKKLGYDVLNNVYAGLIVMLVTATAAALYTRYGAAWERPLINGLVAGAVVLSLFLSARAVLSLPRATAKATPENVGAKVLAWLHKFGLTVQSLNEDGHGFFFIVTTDGGKKITVKRHLTIFPDYITVQGLVTLTDHQRAIIEKFSDRDSFEAMFAIQKELLRARIGFNSHKIDTDGLVMFHRIPITDNLSENDVLDGIWRMEAVIGLVMAVNLKTEMDFQNRVELPAPQS